MSSPLAEKKEQDIPDASSPTLEDLEQVKEDLPKEQEQVLGVPIQEPITNTLQQQAEQVQPLNGNMLILKEAFPDIDTDIIEAILQANNDNLEGSFESLLTMSDPDYHRGTPPMPPRPRDPEVVAREEQMRLDEELAKRLAMEDEMQRRNSGGNKRQQQQQRRQSYEGGHNEEEDSLFNFQEELPIIKEKMKEAGNAAKKKVMELYNQIKANTRNNNMTNNQYQQQQSNPQHQQYNYDGSSSTMPTTKAQYRGLPGSDDGEDLLTGDISALHLSDYDVYKKTTNLQRKSSTSTSEAQLKADEDFARQLQEQEQPANNRRSAAPTVVIATRSPLEFEGDSDYEDVGLMAATNDSNTVTKEKNNSNIPLNKTESKSSNAPYVIGDDDDDSDSDDLVDIDDIIDDDILNEKDEDILEEDTKKVETVKEVTVKDNDITTEKKDVKNVAMDNNSSSNNDLDK